jgi:transcriptional regulator with XRE-family HTH domain
VSFRRELKALIARRAISQRELAARCGKSPAWASRILHGSLPLKSLDEVLMIGKVLELPADEANLLCHGYQSETDSAYSVLLHFPMEQGTRLVLVNETPDTNAIAAENIEMITGTFPVIARAIYGPDREDGAAHDETESAGAEEQEPRSHGFASDASKDDQATG